MVRREPGPIGRSSAGRETSPAPGSWRSSGGATAKSGGRPGPRPADFIGLTAQEDDGLGTVLARVVLERAVASGRVAPLTARLVWAARVEGRTSAELARLAGAGPEAASMARLRAERALRREFGEEVA